MGKILFRLALFTLSGTFNFAQESATPQAFRGVIDLRGINFAESEKILLDGSWEFYWHEFIDPKRNISSKPIWLKVRGHWRDAAHPDGPLPAEGWGSYRLVIQLRAEQSNLAIRVANVGTAYQLFANGQKIAEAGRPGMSAETAVSRTLPLIAELPNTAPDQSIELIVHVSNFDDRHGGLWQSWQIGDREILRNELRNEYVLSTFLFGAIFIIGLHHLLLFWRRPGETANLAFGLLCVLLAVRPLVEASRFMLVLFPDFPWIVNSRLSYLTFYGALPLSSWFFRRALPNQFHLWAHRSILAVMLPVILAVLVLPPRLYTETLSGVQLFALVSILYSLAGIARAILAGVRGSKTLAVGVFFLFAGVTLDILTVANILNLPELTSIGLVAFIVSQSVLISMRDEDAQRLLEILAVENHELIASMEQKIVERTATVAKLSAESDAVLNSLADGVFLVNVEKLIGNKYSSRVLEILEVEPEALAGQSFASLILRITGKTLSEDATRFLKVLFNPMLDDASVRELNPLEKVAIVGKRSQRNKLVHFDFSRQWQEKKIMAIFVSCRDITAEEALRTEIEKREKYANRQLDIVQTLFSVSPEALQAFYGSIESELEDIQREIGVNGSPEIRLRLEAIYRAAHTIKGNAQLFKVDFLSAEVHKFEEVLQELLKRPVLENLDILPVHTAYSGLEKSLDEFEGVILKIMKFQRASGAHASTVELLRDALPKMLGELSHKLGKEARIQFENFTPAMIPRAYGVAIRDALVQCVRNAIAHSLETPAERAAAGKAATGSIVVSAIATEATLDISIRDDGRSFDLDAIRSRAIDRQLGPRDAIQKMSEAELLKFIYMPGFSTAEPGGAVAGRGAGMDIIATKIQNLGGRIDIKWTAGKFTEFTIVLPKK